MKWSLVTRPLPLLAALATMAFGLLSAGPVRAADITWDTPTLISGDADVSTTGSLLYAYVFGDEGVLSTTVNGVGFAPFEVPFNTSPPVTVGSVSLAVNTPNTFYTANTVAGSTSPPFIALSLPYQKLLASGVSIFEPDGTLTLTLGGLTEGQGYMVQFWSNDSDRLSNRIGETIFTAGNSVTLDNNNLDDEGGVGQWVTGSFTADGATEVLTAVSSTPDTDFPVISGFEVREVPEPSPMVLLLCGAALGWRWRLGRKV